MLFPNSFSTNVEPSNGGMLPVQDNPTATFEAILLDIDGTLVDSTDLISSRLDKYPEGSDEYMVMFQDPAFWEQISQDAPVIQSTLNYLQAFMSEYYDEKAKLPTIIVVTARPPHDIKPLLSKCGILGNAPICEHALFWDPIRHPDLGSSVAVKAVALDLIQASGFYPIVALEDNVQVQDHYLENGIPIYDPVSKVFQDYPDNLDLG